MKTTGTAQRLARAATTTSIAVLGLALGAAGCSDTDAARPSSVGSAPSPAAPPASSASPDTVPSSAWTTVTDPGSGASVRLAGPATPGTLATPGGGGRLMLHRYVVDLPNDGGQQRLNVTDLAAPLRDPQAMTKLIADQFGGTVIANTATRVGNHPGADFRVRADVQGRRVLIIGRTAHTPKHSVQVLTMVYAEGEQNGNRLHEQAAASLRIP